MPLPETLRGRAPNLVARLHLYPTSEGGKKIPIVLGYGCPCFASKDTSQGGWDAWPLIGDEEMQPGETRTVGFTFLSGERAAVEMRKAGRFYLWEGRFIGEAEVVADD